MTTAADPTSLSPPVLQDVYLARTRIARLIRPTALIRHPLLEAETGCETWVKHENHNPTCAFKIRGGLNLVESLSAEERARGVVTASTGNHGQSIALACRMNAVACTVVVPRGNNPEKNAAMRAFGANLLEVGCDFDEAREHAEELGRGGLRYIHSANEPLLIAGVATYALEIFEQIAPPDVVFVPIGGGSGAAGLSLVRTALGAHTQVVGVQAQAADAFTRSWRGPERVVGETAATFAEGMATRVTFDLTFNFLKDQLADIVTLSEEELAEGVRLALRATHNLAEGAGAAALMAALKWRERLRDKRIVCIMSGGNMDKDKLRLIVNGR